MSDQPIQPDTTPMLTFKHCDCGSPTCASVMVIMERPVIREVKESAELVSVVYFPIDQMQNLLDHLRMLAAEKGVLVK